MRRALPRLALCLALGVLATIASALALAAWMPLEMYPRHTAYHFVADGRPWGVSGKSQRGVHHLWWSQINEADMSPPPSTAEFARDMLRSLARRTPAKPPDPKWPTTPEGWVQLARNQIDNNRPLPLKLPDGPPPWGTFARTRSAPGQIQSGADHGFGWPLPALWYRVHGAYVVNFSFGTEVVGARLIRGQPEIRGYSFRALPYLPHYPGLILNTALFASLLALLLSTPPALRRHHRLRRGHCPRCGYDVQGNYAAPCPECGAARHKPLPNGR
jgi:hypothetical protein